MLHKIHRCLFIISVLKIFLRFILRPPEYINNKALYSHFTMISGIGHRFKMKEEIMLHTKKESLGRIFFLVQENFKLFKTIDRSNMLNLQGAIR